MLAPRVEGFRVSKLIGNGGCGGVYLATDEKGAEVALKVFDVSAVNLRLLEASTLKLERGGWPEGVLPVHSAEFHQHRALRVMPSALTTGEGGKRRPRTLQHHLAEHPGLDSWKLVKSLARALAAMHSKGVAHGNLKPGNIILTEDNNALLTDWALGNMPGVSQVAFTDAVLYQAPEQLKDPASYEKPDAFRCDVFAFGVLAYRILTGRFPRCHDTFQYVAPPTGETRRDGLKADLSKIAKNLESQKDFAWPDVAQNRLEQEYRNWIDRCLDLDPSKRPLAMPTVSEGIEQADRALVVEKKNELLSEQQRRAERHGSRALFFAGAMAMVALVFAGLWHLQRTRGFQDKSQSANEIQTHQTTAELLVKEKADAEAAMQKAVQELEYERELGLARLEASRSIGDHLFNWAMEKGHRSLPPLDGRELRLKRLERYFVDFLTRTASIEPLDDERARARLQLAEIALAAGDATGATQRLDEALKEWANLPMDADMKFRVASNTLLLALLRQSQSDEKTEAAFADARKAFKAVPRSDVDGDLLDQRLAVLDFHEAQLHAAKGDDTRALEQLMSATQTLNRISDQRPDAVVLRSELAACYLSSASILEGIGNLGDAREVRTLAVAELNKLLRDRPRDIGLRLDLAGSYGAMAEAAVLSGDITGADSLIAEAIRLLDGLLLEQPDHVEALSRKAAQLGLRAGIQRDRGMTAEAMADFEKGIGILERLRLGSGANPMVAYRLGLLWWQKGRMLGMSGKRTDELSYLERARSLLSDLETKPSASGPRPEQLQRSICYLLGDLGHALQLSNRNADAQKVFSEAASLWEGLVRTRPQSEEYSEGLSWCRQRLDDLK